MEAQETNKLIANFMGDKVLYSQLDYCTDEAFPFDDLHFHESWDWLMPVVQKCYKIDSHEAFNNLVDAVAILDIDATYKAVVQFIEYVNQNK